jgi:DNA repair protein RAD57
MRSLRRHACSASGKTQLALQLALAVQLPVARHGLNGAACYLTTSAGLPTPRLLELAQKHPTLRGAASLAHVHTLETRSVEALLGVLSTALPLLIDRRPNARRVRLLVVDALADLFREDTKTTTAQLVVRSRALADVSRALHGLASAHALAIVVLNHVVEVFEHAPARARHELLYADQARLFASGDLAAEAHKKAALGLVWANQLNARIMLTRTSRRRVLEALGSAPKRRRVGGADTGSARSSEPPPAEETLVRRLSLLFSTASPPASADFIVAPHGVELLSEDMPGLFPDARRVAPPARLSAVAPSALQLGDVASLDAACAQASSSLPSPDAAVEDLPLYEDEEAYWRSAGMDDVWDAVEQDAAF